MNLHLIRHAKTEQYSPTNHDFDRFLMKKGLFQCAQLQNHLKSFDFKNAHVACSTAKRTQETLEGLHNLFLVNQVEMVSAFYLCSLQTYLDWIWSQKHQNDLVLIGHNFGISDLANYFLDDNLEMKTSEYVHISFPFDKWDEVSRSTGSLMNRFRPSVAN